MRAFCVAVVLCAIPLTAPAARAGDGLRGKWQVVSIEMRGTKLPADAMVPLKAAVLELDGGKLTIRMGNRVVHEGQYKANARSSPKTIEGNLTGQPGRGGTQPEAAPGIYEVQGDLLRICVGDPGGTRPRAFATAGPGSGQALLTYRRVK